MVNQFGVSRPVVREAIRLLAAKGLVVVKQGSGTWVQAPERWDHLDPAVLFERARASHDVSFLNKLLEARRLVEVEIAGLAALRRTAEDLAELRDLVEGMRQALPDPDRYTELDGAFHDRLSLAADNEILRGMIRSVAQLVHAGRRINNRLVSTDVLEGFSQRGHEAIFDAVAAGDAATARAATDQHITRFQADIRQGLLSRPDDLIYI